MTSSLPPKPRRRTLFFAIPAVGPRWPGGARTALAFGLPALIALALGFETEALLTVAGAFAVVYGEGRAYRIRWAVVLTAGVALVVSTALGGIAGTYGNSVAVVVGMTVVGVVATYVVDAARLGPPGAFFFVLAYGISTVVSNAGISVATNVLCVCAGVASSLLVTMSGVVWRPRKPQTDAVHAAVAAVNSVVDAHDRGEPTGPLRHDASGRVHHAWSTLHDAGLQAKDTRNPDPVVDELRTAHLTLAGIIGGNDALRAADTVRAQLPLARPTVAYRLRHALSVDSHASTTALRVLVASSAAGAVSIALGLSRPDWAVIAAVLVLQTGLDRTRGTVRGMHRVAGTVVGVGLFMALFAASLQTVVLVIVLMLLSFAIELFIARNYGIAVAFITPLALLVSGSSHPGASAASLGIERIVETAVGVVFALASMWFVAPRAYRRCLRWCDSRVVATSSELLDRLATSPPSDELVLRRDVQFELVGAALAAEHAAHDDRAWTAERWPGHVAVVHLGYEFLAECWATPDGEVMADIDGWRDRVRVTSTGLRSDHRWE